MRIRHRPLAVSLVVMVSLVACGSAVDVRSSRADPLDSRAPTSTTEPTQTTAATEEVPIQTTEPSAPDDGTLEWGRCDDPAAVDPTLECSTLAVPLDYDDPQGQTLDLALIRVPAEGDRAGAVLFNPGGPGGSGFDYTAAGGTVYTSGLGTNSFDFVGFDPRGVDRSGGIRCIDDEFLDDHLYVDDTPDTPEEQTLFDESRDGFVEACKQKYGDTLRFYSTENTARDMDAIREALGDEQISFLGVSYGTYLGAVYATMFPDRVRAMVFDSVYEPIGDTAQQALETQPIGFEGAFDNWAKWCEGDSSCHFNAPDVGARWDALKQRLDDAPLADATGRTANNATVERATVAALYSEAEWRILAQALANAEGGDPAGILTIADTYNHRRDDGSFDTLFQSFPVITCASGIEAPLPDDPESLAAILRAEAPRFARDVTADDLTAPAEQCDSMVGDVDPVEVSYSGDGPIVLIGGANDPATPIRWAEKMVGELGPNARLVRFTGEGHGQLLVNDCVTDIEGALLVELTLPEPDTVCDANPTVVEPEWWDALPVPDGISDVAVFPNLAVALGADPTSSFTEMRTTSLDADEAIDAYTAALSEDGFEQFETPSAMPLADAAQGAYSDFESKTLVVIALGPTAFDGAELANAKLEVPPDTTVVWLIAVDL